MWRWGLVVLLSGAVVAGCGGDDETRTADAPAAGAGLQGFDPLTGADVIAATRAEGSATLVIEDLGAPADPGGDHGAVGEEEDNLVFDVAFDFARNRAITTIEFPPAFGMEATNVEVRTIDGTSYVRDGSWLCPGCGMDDDEPLPSDKWITFEVGATDLAFEFGDAAFHHQLAWLSLLAEPLTPGAVSRLDDGTLIAAYETTVPVDDVHAAGGPADRGEYAPQLQGESVRIRFTADSHHRLHELIVEYHVEDRARTLTATVVEVGSGVEVEVPPDDEIYVEP